MVQTINFNKPIERINYNIYNNLLPEEQRERELDLQERAGIELSTRYEETRQGLALEQEEDSMQNLYRASENALKNGVDPKAVSDFIRAYVPDVTGEDIDIALEAAAGERQVVEAFQNNKQTALNNAVDGIDPTDDMIKAELRSTFLKKIDAYIAGRSPWTKFKNFARTFIDPQLHQNWAIQSYLPEEAFKEGKSITQEGYSKAIFKYFQDNWNKAQSAREYADFLDNTYDYIIKQNPNVVMLQDMKDALETGANPWIDRLGFAEVLAMGAGAVKNGFQAAKRAGDVSKIKQLATAAAKKTNKEELVKEALTPSITKPVQNAAELAGEGYVAEQLAIDIGGATADEVVKAARVSGIYNEAELGIIGKRVKEDIGEVFGKSAIDPMDVFVKEDSEGMLKAVAVFGDNSGKALTLKRAENLAGKLGFEEGTYEIIKKDGAGFYVRKEVDITTDSKHFSRYSSFDKTQPDITDEWSYKGFLESPINWLLKHFGGSTKIGKEAHDRAVEADRIFQGLVSKFHKDYKSSFNRLDKEGKQALRTVFKEGLQGFGKWFKPEELAAKGLSDEQVAAYYNFKKVSDIQYLANNADKRTILNRKGYKVYGEYIGKEERVSLLNTKIDVIKDTEGNLVTDLSKYSSDEYVAIRVNRQQSLKEDYDFTHIIMKKTEANAAELPQYVTSYMPGGRREYTIGNKFVKIGRSVFNPVTKTKMNGFVKTFVAGTDVAKLQKYADEMNEAIDIFKMFQGDEVTGARMLEQANFQEFKVDNWEDLKSMMRTSDNPKGDIDPEYRAQVVESNQPYDFGNTLENLSDDMRDEDWALQELLDMRAKYSRHRGNALDDINGGTARIVDLDDIYDKTIQRAAYSLAKGDLVHWYAKELDSFKKVISNWDEVSKLSDMEKLNRATVLSVERKDLSQDQLRMLRSAERFLGHSRRILNSKTKWDIYLQNTMTRTAKMLDCVLPKEWQRGKVFETVANANPSKVARALGFNYVMGWWNPAQLVKQGLGTLNVVALEPVNGAKAMMLYPLVRLARASGDYKGVFKVYRDAAMKLSGLTEKEFDDLLKYVDRYATKNASGLLVGADKEYGSALARDKNLFKKAWDTQYVFMKEGNAANFYVADIAAYLSKKGSDFREIAGYADDLFVNMTKTSESAFQAGQSLPTAALAQWMTYPMRMVETLFSGRLTTAQKARLWGSQIALWGTAGTFGDDETDVNMYSGLVKHGISPEMADVITNGLIGAAAHDNGIYIDEGLGLKEQLTGMFGVYDAVRGEFKLPNIPAGKALPQGLAILSAINEMVAPETGDYDFWRYLKYVATTKNLPSSWRNTSKALLAMKYKKFYDNYGDEIKSDAETHHAIAQFLGFGPYETKQLRDMYVGFTDREEALEAMIERIKPYADAMKHYNYLDPDKEQHLKIIEENYKTVLRGELELLRESFPEGDTMATAYKRIQDLLFTPAERSTEKKTIKSYDQLGIATTQIILRNSEEIRNGLRK